MVHLRPATSEVMAHNRTVADLMAAQVTVYPNIQDVPPHATLPGPGFMIKPGRNPRIVCMYCYRPIPLRGGVNGSIVALKCVQADCRLKHGVRRFKDEQVASAKDERDWKPFNLLRDALSWYDAHTIDHLPQWVQMAREFFK